ncbi:MAG: hypothetical protein ACTSRQ_14410 [Candidatus Thorarchaeota archaeon]
MPDLSVLAHRLNDNTEVLEAYDHAIRYFKKQKMISKPDTEMVRNLLSVLNPILVRIGENLSYNSTFSVDSVVRIIKQKKNVNWQSYQIQLKELVQKIELMDSDFLTEDFRLLDDIGDALDSECANIFRRMGKR